MLPKKVVQYRKSEQKLSKQGKSKRRKLESGLSNNGSFEDSASCVPSDEPIITNSDEHGPVSFIELNTTGHIDLSDEREQSYENIENDDNLTFKEDLRQLYLKDPSMTRTNLDQILKIINKHSKNDKLDVRNLPLDVRTLVGAKQVIEPKDVSGGKSIYLGFQKCIEFLIRNSIVLPNTLVFDINIDGAPVFENPYVNVSIWPVLLSFKNIKGLEKKVFPISIFCGSKKPDSHKFLEDFIAEYLMLKDGFRVKGIDLKLKLGRILMDVPAHSFICSTVSHNGYYSCFKCTIRGEHINCVMTFLHNDNPNDKPELRTNESFREKHQIEHHKGETILLDIPDLDLINQIPIDPMHCVYLGVARKLLKILFVGRNRNGGILSKTCAEKVTEMIRKTKNNLPQEFHRNLRCIDQINKYKAKELRLFTLYIGIYAMKDNLSTSRYTNFLNFHCAVKILSDEDFSKDRRYREIAQTLIENFKLEIEEEYGPHEITYNMHLLTHLASEVKIHGPLDDFSNFLYENYLGYLKKLVNSPFKPLEQIKNRICEIYEYALLQKDQEGIIFNETSETVSISGVLLDSRFPNSIVSLKSSKIVRVTRIEKMNNAINLTGFILRTEDYFKDPIKSSTIGCFVAVGESSHQITFALTDVKRKMVPFKLSNHKTLIIPMTHNLL